MEIILFGGDKYFTFHLDSSFVTRRKFIQFENKLFTPELLQPFTSFSYPSTNKRFTQYTYMRRERFKVKTATLQYDELLIALN